MQRSSSSGIFYWTETEDPIDHCTGGGKNSGLSWLKKAYKRWGGSSTVSIPTRSEITFPLGQRFKELIKKLAEPGDGNTGIRNLSGESS